MSWDPMQNMNNNSKKAKAKVGKKSDMTYLPAAQSKPMRTGVPKLSGSAYLTDGRVRVQHREYIGDVLGSVAFSVNTFSVNPGLNSTFPWLSAVASRYESYLLRNLSFEFETQKGSATVGSVMMAVDYDASDAAPVSKQQLMSYHDAVRSAVWNSCCFRCDTKDLQKFGVQRYLRSGALAANLDIKTFDVGNLFIATQGCADATAIGELYVIYDVELITPQLDVSAETLAASAKITGAGTVNLANVYGTVSGTIVGGLPLTAVGGTLTFNRVGEFLVVQDIAGTVLAGAPTITGTCTHTGSTLFSRIDGAATAQAIAIRVKVNNIGETLILDYTGHANTVSGSVTRVCPYSYALA